VLLGDVVIVNSIENAKRAIASNICEKAVTLDGTTVQASGIVRGGGTTSNEGVTIGKKEQIEKLLIEIDKLSQKLEKLESDSRVISTYESVINLSKISNSVRLAQESLGNIEKVRNKLEYEKNNADEVIITNEKEVQSLLEEIKSLDILLLEISPKIESHVEDQKFAEENVRVVNLQLSAKETEFSEKMRILNSLNVQLTELINEDRNSLNSIDRLDSDLRNTLNFITQRTSDKERSIKEVELITNDLKQIADGLILFNASLENAKINRDEIISEQSNKRLEIIQRSDLLRTDRKSYESTVSEIHTLELKIQELKQKAASLVERAKDELDIDLLKLIEDLKLIEERKFNNNINSNIENDNVFNSENTIINNVTINDSNNEDKDICDIDSGSKVTELHETEITETSIITIVDSDLTVFETFESNSSESNSSESISSKLNSNIIYSDISFDLTNIETTLTEFRDKLREVKSRIKILGTVNLLAYQEWKEEDDRLKFINVQYNDLRKAEKILLDTIDEINNIAQKLFIETFEKIRLNFIGLFGNLFNEGDEADLKIMEGDPLEAKIEIIAKPRGKRPHSIDLLSGGEKTLTAIALLFSIYLVKPSPFCILDEVDAPLDDTNIDRFVNLIRKFVGNTQFIIVTHNKRTMAAADTMYGVTQEESGVSKIVSVQFENNSKQKTLVN
jgi:chromosome segregation protein